MSASRRRVALAATASAVVLVLCGCGSGGGGGASSSASPSATSPSAESPGAASPAPSASATDHSPADLTFALTMLPHHLQAEELAGLVSTRSDDARLVALATDIARTQHAEAEQLAALLGAWQASPDGALSDSEHMGGVDGMMTDAQMTALGDLSGTAFRTQWLRMMIAHHQGAMALARTELASGTNAQTRALATSILASKQAQVDRMQALLSG